MYLNDVFICDHKTVKAMYETTYPCDHKNDIPPINVITNYSAAYSVALLSHLVIAQLTVALLSHLELRSWTCDINNTPLTVIRNAWNIARTNSEPFGIGLFR